MFYLINLFKTNGIFHKLIKLSQYGPLYILRGHSYNIHQNSVFLSLKIDSVLANSADPDKMRLMRHSSGSSRFANIPYHLGVSSL